MTKRKGNTVASGKTAARTASRAPSRAAEKTKTDTTGETAAPAATLFPRESLYDWARMAWSRADWSALAALAPQPLAEEAHRDRLALLVAAGLSQEGSLEGVRRLLEQAADWGASRRMIAQILTSGAYNSLGRAALAAGDGLSPARYFEAAVVTTGPATDIRDSVRARQAQETTWLKAATDPGARATPATDRQEVLDHFADRLPGWRPERDLPYLLEVKSLPRSGLHFLKSCFQTVLGGRFSFCEWYQEPGCCRRHPCTLASMSLDQAAGPEHPLRMVKSHDFELGDPDYAPPPGVVRLIMTRDPLMILTSWWALSELDRHTALLQANGIAMNKVYFLHEKLVLTAAHDLLEKNFHAVPAGYVDNWLAQKSDYIVGFMKKWAAPASPQVQLLSYDDLPGFVSGFFEDRMEALGAPQKQAAADLSRTKLAEFNPRGATFTSKVRQITDTLKEHEASFRAASDMIRQKSGVGWN